jgi:Fuc2NAc and GlcNAc transferase
MERRLLDVPNVRSSHTKPTPRGGGIATVGAVLLALAVALPLGLVDYRLALALGGGGALVAWVGWWDDKSGLRPRARAVWHGAAAVWALAWLGGLPALRLGEWTVPLGLWGWPLALVGIVWAINLFNFMDGIDGIAGVEALSVGAGGAALLWTSGHGGSAVPLAVAFAALGFLRWNWAPAGIFMGDVGSGFLGYVFAVIAIWSENTAGPPVLAWGVLAMVFVFDATVTLVRRALRRERLAEAHRTHAYQRLVQAGWSHAGVSGAVLGINLALIALLFVPGIGILAALAGAMVCCGLAYLWVGGKRSM